ncbi:hypothetical protein K6Y31_21240 [Motilimonas cestriensis]|uniref:Uncharacterized protein n=1 Tax=Motilimonas cestriensis TaxID=2742685 RepID=A0ABS8WE26_9GAMM|nr:hypothetical protein [Motilimonas cestriensis]MCE2597301.1 hypothetical protein [Motilimonas cestriensis]
MSNPTKPKQQKQNRAAKPRVVRHKLLRVELKFKSEMLFAFINRSTTLGIRANTEAAFRRLGVIMHMVIRDKDVKPKIEGWFNEVMADAATSLQEIEAQNAMFAGEQQDDFQITVPDNFQLIMEANHPAYLQLVNLIKIADELSANAENHWYFGAMTDDQKEHCRTQIEYVFNRISNRVAAVTNISGRDGGSYSPQEFVRAVREDRVSFDEKVSTVQLNQQLAKEAKAALAAQQTVDRETKPESESTTPDQVAVVASPVAVDGETKPNNKEEVAA